MRNLTHRLASLLVFSLFGLPYGAVAQTGLPARPASRSDFERVAERMRPASSVTSSSMNRGQPGMLPSYLRSQIDVLPPSVPNAVFRFVGESTDDCPVLVQIVDDEISTEGRSGPSEGSSLRRVVAGVAPLSWLASSFVVERATASQVTWLGFLEPDYENCERRGYLSHKGGAEIPPGKSHFTLVMKSGQLRLTLDLSRLEGARVEESGVEEQQPTWLWSVPAAP